jgi:hypothetical protein
MEQVDAERTAHVAFGKTHGGHEVWQWGPDSVAPNTSYGNHLAKGGNPSLQVPDGHSRKFELVVACAGYVGYGGPVTSTKVFGPDFVHYEDGSTEYRHASTRTGSCCEYGGRATKTLSLW